MPDNLPLAEHEKNQYAGFYADGVVQLITGGPLMTVESVQEVDKSSPGIAQRGLDPRYNYQILSCVWFDGHNKLHKGSFWSRFVKRSAVPGSMTG